MQVLYRLTSPSDRVYIGQTKQLSQRLSSYRTLKCKQQTLLYRSLVKYGFDAHTVTVLHRFPQTVSQQVIDDYERYAIQCHKYMSSVKGLLNLTCGGRGNGHRRGQESKPRPDVQGSKHKRAKLTEAEVIEMRAYYQRGVRGRGYRQVAQLWNVSHKLAVNVIKRKTWKHV